MARSFNVGKIGKTGGFFLAIVSAAVIGGLSSGFVRASIPDGNGTIHSCYSTGRGSLYIIDNSSQSCGTGETGLNWNQSGAVTLHDADGQTLGSVVGYTFDSGGSSSQQIFAYNSTLNRAIEFIWNNGNSQMDIGAQVVPVFESNDCSGQGYIGDDPSNVSIRTSLLRWFDGSSTHYVTVANNATTSNIHYHSVRRDNGDCDGQDDTADLHPLTSATLPFDTPVTTPLKF